MTALTGKAPLPSDKNMIPCRNLSLEESLKIYQNNYYRNLQSSLSQTYEACAALTTEKIFEKIAFAFIRHHPPTQSDLALYGDSFPQFLKNSDLIMSNWPFLPELAELEKIIKQLFLHGESHSEMEVTFPVHQIWRSLLHEGKEIDDFDGKKILSVHRDNSECLFFELREIP